MHGIPFLYGEGNAGLAVMFQDGHRLFRLPDDADYFHLIYVDAVVGPALIHRYEWISPPVTVIRDAVAFRLYALFLLLGGQFLLRQLGGQFRIVGDGAVGGGLGAGARSRIGGRCPEGGGGLFRRGGGLGGLSGQKRLLFGRGDGRRLGEVGLFSGRVFGSGEGSGGLAGLFLFPGGGRGDFRQLGFDEPANRFALGFGQFVFVNQVGGSQVTRVRSGNDALMGALASDSHHGFSDGDFPDRLPVGARTGPQGDRVFQQHHGFACVGKGEDFT